MYGLKFHPDKHILHLRAWPGGTFSLLVYDKERNTFDSKQEDYLLLRIDGLDTGMVRKVLADQSKLLEEKAHVLSTQED